MIKYIAQEESDGCLVACVAMVTGRTYKEIRAMAGPAYKDGINYVVANDILADLGYAVMCRYRHQARVGGDRPEWPCTPFAPVHIAYVIVTAGSHAAVVQSDGLVLDPWSIDRRSLLDPVYREIHHIDGIFRVD